MKKRLIALLLILAMAVPVFAVEYDHVVKEFTNLKQGDQVEVVFKKNVPESKMDLDGFEFIGKEGNTYSFRATRDMDNASITLEYSKKEEEVEVDGGGSSVGEIGSGEGGALDWDLVELGKRAWGTPGSNEVRFAIALDARKYDTDKIIIKDSFTNLTNLNSLYINLLAPDQDGIAKSIGFIDADEYDLEVYEDHFILSFATNSQAAIYEVDYCMDKTAEDFSNNYKAYTMVAWEEAGGSGTGNTTEPEDAPTECPPVPTCPMPEECDHAHLEDRIKELEKELEEREKVIEDLKNQPPEIVEKEVIKEIEKIVEVPVEVIKEIIVEKEIPRYITEIIFKEVEKEVIKEVEKPVYITELQIKEIEKVIEKEIEVVVEKIIKREVEIPIYTEVETVKEIPVYIEMPCECDCSENNEPEVDKDRETEEESNPVIPTPPEVIEEEKQPEIDKDIPQEDNEDIEIDEGIVDEKDEDMPEEDTEEPEEKSTEDKEEDKPEIIEEEELEEDILPKTGEGDKKKFFLGGIIILGLGLLLIVPEDEGRDV